MLRALPPSYRQRALSEIEALIARAERDLARHDAAQTGKSKAQDRLRQIGRAHV